MITVHNPSDLKFNSGIEFMEVTETVSDSDGYRETRKALHDGEPKWSGSHAGYDDWYVTMLKIIITDTASNYIVFLERIYQVSEQIWNIYRYEFLEWKFIRQETRTV